MTEIKAILFLKYELRQCFCPFSFLKFYKTRAPSTYHTDGLFYNHYSIKNTK